MIDWIFFYKELSEKIENNLCHQKLCTKETTVSGVDGQKMVYIQGYHSILRFVLTLKYYIL